MPHTKSVYNTAKTETYYMQLLDSIYEKLLELSKEKLRLIRKKQKKGSAVWEKFVGTLPNIKKRYSQGFFPFIILFTENSLTIH